jgi:biopolymer transport protein ExbB/TolQ
MSIPIALSLATSQVALLIAQAAVGPEGSAAVENLSLLEMLHRMQWPARLVAIILAVMSIYSISVMIERWLTFNAARNQSRQFIPKAAAALRDQEIDNALTVSEQHKKSHLAIVVNAGLQEYLLQQEVDNSVELTDALHEALDRARALKIAELSRGLSGLATIGSTAPFVGLLGTVIGIINAFQGMRLAEGTGISAVAGGISEALIETGFGLIVAIPAVWTFNHFSHRLDSFRIEMNNSSSELMAYLKKHWRNRAKSASE